MSLLSAVCQRNCPNLAQHQVSFKIDSTFKSVSLFVTDWQKDSFSCTWLLAKTNKKVHPMPIIHKKSQVSSNWLAAVWTLLLTKTSFTQLQPVSSTKTVFSHRKFLVPQQLTVDVNSVSDEWSCLQLMSNNALMSLFSTFELYNVADLWSQSTAFSLGSRGCDFCSQKFHKKPHHKFYQTHKKGSLLVSGV